MPLVLEEAQECKPGLQECRVEGGGGEGCKMGRVRKVEASMDQWISLTSSNWDLNSTNWGRLQIFKPGMWLPLPQ